MSNPRVQYDQLAPILDKVWQVHEEDNGKMPTFKTPTRRRQKEVNIKRLREASAEGFKSVSFDFSLCLRCVRLMLRRKLGIRVQRAPKRCVFFIFKFYFIIKYFKILIVNIYKKNVVIPTYLKRRCFFIHITFYLKQYPNFWSKTCQNQVNTKILS